MATLVEPFSRATLPLELRTIPLAWNDVGTGDIVQIDITREARKASDRKTAFERFRIYPGHASNRLEVLDVDARQRQLVLFVQEMVRGFAVKVRRDRPLPEDAVIVREDRKHVWIEEQTSDRERQFLCGMDEQHLFIALLPDAVRTVGEAHASLRDPRVDVAEAGAPEPTVRQGEWFFVALPHDEELRVQHLARKVLRVARNVGIADAAGIRRLRRAHVADEVLVVSGIPDAAGDTSARTYVRGSVRHPDHATVVFPSWRRTIVNRESIEAPIPGVDWID